MKSQPRVLIVDNQDSIRETLRLVLKDFDCIFSETGDGESALKLMQSDAFEVIFLDIRLHNLSGIDILRKAQENFPLSAKVIILTGFPEPATRIAAEELGVFKYLTKTQTGWTEIREVFASAIGLTPAPSAPKPQPSEPRQEPILPAEEHETIVAGPKDKSIPQILILDDQQGCRHKLRDMLKDNFRLVLTGDDVDACRWIEKEHFDLAVLDMRLGAGKSGFDVLTKMRQINPVLKAIILTGYPDPPTAFVAGQRGVLGYVDKRTELSMLPDIIHKILAQSKASLSVFLCYDRSDLQEVSGLCDRLEEDGFLPWMDTKNLLVGQKWQPVIDHVIDQSDFFIFCLSSRSAFKEGAMLRELRRAEEILKGKQDETVFFIVARLEEYAIPARYREYHFVDLFRKEGYAKLLQALASKRKVE